MRVFVLGGYGLIGSSVVARLSKAGCQIVGLTRSPRISSRFPNVEWHEGDISQLTSTDDWQPLISGCDAVVNCAGALQDSGTDSLAAVHVTGPLALYRACVEVGIRRVVHISAAGISEIDTGFARTKREAEAQLTDLDLDWVILRPGLVIGPNAFGGTALLRGLAGFPIRVPVPDTDTTVQIISLHEVAETVWTALKDNSHRQIIWELVHPEHKTIQEIVPAFRAWLGLRPQPLAKIPLWFVQLISLGADASAHLGWRSPLRSTSLRQLGAGVGGDPKPWIEDTGIQPKSLKDIFAEHPAGLQEVRFARTYFVKPMGLIVLSLFWVCSGLIGLSVGFEEAIRIMRMTSLPEFAAAPSVIGGSLLDICLGVGVAFHRTARTALIGMILTCGVYVIGGAIFLPDLWFDPLGALVKAFPIAFAALAMLALMDER
jgi:uncharacterized protein YbjT (DUF2867 family)